jgi:hypothetical protein
MAAWPHAFGVGFASTPNLPWPNGAMKNLMKFYFWAMADINNGKSQSEFFALPAF